jgi:hypothetical protein
MVLLTSRDYLPLLGSTDSLSMNNIKNHTSKPVFED